VPLTKLQFKPGIVRETTSYTNEGGWYDCDKVRFRYGLPEKMGGWEKKSNTQFLGSARALHPWVSLASNNFIGIGTNLKYYIEEGGGYNDITPIRSTTAAGDVTFAATSGSTIITVSDTAHGAVANDFVTFSGAASLGGQITADVLNAEHQIVTINNANEYTIDVGVAADGSDSGNGGASVVGAYQINVGLDTSVAGAGWGAGTWSRGTWGSAASLSATSDVLRLWAHDNFGEDLIINIRDGGIYYWDKSANYGVTYGRAVELNSLAGADAGTPTIAKKVFVSDRDRHVIALGCDPVESIGTQDPLLIRFSNQEDPTTWIPTATNTAGDIRLSSGSEIITSVETRQQILIWTDVSLHAMQYLGPPFTFGVGMISENTTIMAPNAAVAVDDSVFWMGQEEFYVYSGGVQKLPCTVRQFVFEDFNLDQKQKVFAALNSSFGEIWWFYPSENSDNNDRYVVYNYEQQIWYYGALARTAWIDRGINDFPIAAGADGYLYLQEFGCCDGSTTPLSVIGAYIESSQVDIQDGDNFVFIRRVIPDLTFEGSTTDTPSANLIIKTRNFPGGDYLQSDTAQVTRTAVVPVEQFTNQVHIRLRGRSFALRVESDSLGTAWRLGSPRLDVRGDGRR